jgi:hypothetical protein
VGILQSLGPADVFAAILDRLIRREGGAGNFGQLRVRLHGPLDAAALDAAWRRLGEEAWPLGARLSRGLRGLRLAVPGPVPLRLERGGDLAATAATHLRHGTGRALARLALIDHPEAPALVFTWHHGLCDARAALGLLAALPALAGGGRLGERWWEDGYRSVPGLPATARARGQQAQEALALLRPHRLVRLCRPLQRRGRLRSPANPAAPVLTHHLALGAEATAAMQARQRQASGRMAETPFLMACVAAALEAACGVGGDVLLPLAVDLREPGQARLLANCHGYCFLRVPAGLATADLAAASQHLKQAHRDWTAADGLLKLSSSMSWFRFVPQRLAQAQLGNHGPGVWASCVVANSGASQLPEPYFGARVLGIDHAAVIPGTPGLGALFHRDARGLVVDTLASGRVARVLPPARFAELIRWQLLERPLAAPAMRPG